MTLHNQNKKAKKSCFRNIKASTNNVLSPEKILMRIRKITDDEKISTNEICQIISSNTKLTNDIIVTTNALRKRPDAVTDIKYAVMFLGMKKLDSVIKARV